MTVATIGTPVTSGNPNTTTNTSLSVALATTTPGALNIIEISGLANGTTINPTMTTPSGWAKLLERMDTNGTPASFVAVYYRKYQSGDGSSVTISWTNAGQMIAICTPVTGQDATNPIPWSTSDFKVNSDVNYSIAGTTGADAGLLCYGFANRSGAAWSSLSDNDRGQNTLTASSTMACRVTAAEVAGGTAFTKTAVGSNTSVGVSWAFVIKGGAPPLDASWTVLPASGAANLTVTATVTVNGGVPPFTYAYNWGDGSTAGSTATVTHTYTTAGTYTPTCDVTDSA